MHLPRRPSPGPSVRRAVGFLPLSATGSLLGLLGLGLAAWWTLHLLGREDWIETVTGYGALTGFGLQAGQWWQVLSHVFVPDSAAWLLCVHAPILWLAGRHLERIVGRRHVLSVFALATGVGGLAQLAYDAWVLGRPGVALAGVSAPTVAVFTALAGIVPELELVPPLVLSTGSHGPAWLRIKHGATGVLLVLGAALLARPAGTFAGEQAVRCLAGGLTGCLYVRQLGFGRRRGPAMEVDPDHAATMAASAAAAEAAIAWRDPEPHPTAVAAPVAAAAGTLVVPRFTERERRMSAREYIEEVIDPVLDKISRHGLGSLTEEERRLLDKAREKMAAATHRLGAKDRE